MKAIVVDGFEFQPSTGLNDTDGDADVIAPDGSYAGLVWDTRTTDPSYSQIFEFGPARWGVYEIAIPLPMRDHADAAEFLRTALPYLRPKWEEWTRRKAAGEFDQ